jgi:hypothetical protein
MNRRAVICSLMIVTAMSAVAAVDKKATPSAATKPVPAIGGRVVDPLGLPADLELITAKAPQSGAIGSNPGAVTETGAGARSGKSTLVFRVQIYTTQGFGDARKASQVAQEIFDQAVHIDYEVPNFKVRVGDFPVRDDAESYRRSAQALGYANAWVVSVTVGINQAAPLYDSLPLPQRDSSIATDSGGRHAGPK